MGPAEVVVRVGAVWGVGGAVRGQDRGLRELGEPADPTIDLDRFELRRGSAAFDGERERWQDKCPIAQRRTRG